MADFVVDLKDRRPIWAIPPWAVEELRAALPDDWTLHVAESFADGTGDGAGGPPPEVLDALRGARVYVGYGIPPAVLEAGGDTLEWVHTGTAGVGGSLHDAMRSGRARFTNSAGTHGPPIAESVVAALLHFARGLDFAAAAQREARWDPSPFLAADTPVRELGVMTVGILGYGGIGREIGARLRALGSRVLGLRRTDEVPPAGPAAGRGAAPDPEGMEILHGRSGLERLLAESDALVLSAPDTPETRGILDRDRIRALPRGAVVVNVSRGSLVDEDALVEALRDGHLRGAALDVFAAEPLAEGHPFWGLPNVLVTPHVSAVSRRFWRREMDLVLENFRRLRSGPDTPLLNEVDPERGY